MADKPLLVLVDDAALNRLLFATMLEPRYEVVTYGSGAEALEGIAARRPAAVLLDLSMPGLTGPDVLKTLRAQPGGDTLPVIALTAHTDTADRDACLEMGFNDYLTKPVLNEAAFFDVLEKWIGA